MPKHDWSVTPPQRHGTGISSERRKCALCGAVQEKSSDYSWGRIYGYSWYPLAGVCVPSLEIKARLNGGKIQTFRLRTTHGCGLDELPSSGDIVLVRSDEALLADMMAEAEWFEVLVDERIRGRVQCFQLLRQREIATK